VAPEWDENLIFVEDNNELHGTKGKADNKVKQAKIRLNIKWEAQPSNSPDLNPIETIWRIIKQRLKNRGVIFQIQTLKRAIQEEWDKITIEEINKAISTMPDRVTCLNERFGKAIPY
jgi:transposase